MKIACVTGVSGYLVQGPLGGGEMGLIPRRGEAVMERRMNWEAGMGDGSGETGRSVGHVVTNLPWL